MLSSPVGRFHSSFEYGQFTDFNLEDNSQACEPKADSASISPEHFALGHQAAHNPPPLPDRALARDRGHGYQHIPVPPYHGPHYLELDESGTFLTANVENGGSVCIDPDSGLVYDAAYATPGNASGGGQ